MEKKKILYWICILFIYGLFFLSIILIKKTGKLEEVVQTLWVLYGVSFLIALITAFITMADNKFEKSFSIVCKIAGVLGAITLGTTLLWAFMLYL